MNTKTKAYTFFTFLSLALASKSYCQEQDSTATPERGTTPASVYDSVPLPYFNVSKLSSTASVSLVQSVNLQKTPTQNITNTLYGLAPGLLVNQGNGTPGYDGAGIWIRGIGSYNYGSYAIFVDGFQTDIKYLQYLSPQEIESIAVLKDAAALAVFGVKGANGALWVTTKRGVKSKPTVELNSVTGIQQPMGIKKPLQSYDYAALYNEAKSNDNYRTWLPTYSTADLINYQQGYLSNTDWYKNTLRDNPVYTATNLSLRGGGDAVRFFTFLGYSRDNGFYNVKNDDTHSNIRMQLYNVRTNLDFNLFKFFEGKIDIGGRIENRAGPNYSSASLWQHLASYPNNIYDVRNTDGTWPGTAVHPNNPYASISELGYVSTHDRLLQANLSLKEKLDFFVPGLYLKQAISFSTWTRGTYSVTKDYARLINNIVQTNNAPTNYQVIDDYGTNQWSSRQFQGTLGYDKTIDASTLNIAVEYLQYLNRVDENMNGNGGINVNYGFQNIGARIHYDYSQKYIGEISLAYSGSDNYQKGNRFSFYPALSGAWIIFNNHLQNTNFNFLKLRASAGIAGYDYFNGYRYLYVPYFAARRSFLIGNGNPSTVWGLEPMYKANPNITAEKSYKYNIAIESKFFDKLSVVLEGFIDNRRGVVTYDNSMPGVYGAVAAYENMGKVNTKGIEISIDYLKQAGKFWYSFGGNATHLRDKIIFMGEVDEASPNSAKTGRSIGTPFGYEASGFYDITDFDAAGKLKSGIPIPNFGEVQPGDIRYKDINSDNIIDNRDMVQIGHSFLPKLSYSFKLQAGYKGFDFRALFQGINGRSISLLDSWSKIIAFENNGTAYDLAKGRWAYYPEQGIDTRANASYPRLSLVNNTNNYIPSTFWQKSGDFLRLRTIELGYSIPASTFKRQQIKNCRFYLNAVNPLTFSSMLKKYGLDPETPIGYPAVKSYNLGLTFNL